MALDDYVDPEFGLAVAATALVLSSRRARRWLHEGAVYGLAGVLTAGDALLSFGRGIGRGLQLGAPRAAELSTGDGARAADAQPGEAAAV